MKLIVGYWAVTGPGLQARGYGPRATGPRLRAQRFFESEPRSTHPRRINVIVLSVISVFASPHPSFSSPRSFFTVPALHSG